MGKAYSEADIIISRAGAMTLSEICELSKPSILLPLPWSADDHQYKNALYLQNLGAAILIESDLQNSKKLFELLISIEKEHNRRDSMAFAARKAFPESSSKLIYKKIHESLKI
jgi:UDP-N-acetylglucosamine--N-acetylmuramyl-(pentapeptide) pyrophosphoryl-undecaprenol N-acetylglucosamine transferase